MFQCDFTLASCEMVSKPHPRGRASGREAGIWHDHGYWHLKSRQKGGARRHEYGVPVQGTAPGTCAARAEQRQSDGGGKPSTTSAAREASCIRGVRAHGVRLGRVVRQIRGRQRARRTTPEQLMTRSSKCLKVAKEKRGELSRVGGQGEGGGGVGWGQEDVEGEEGGGGRRRRKCERTRLSGDWRTNLVREARRGRKRRGRRR